MYACILNYFISSSEKEIKKKEKNFMTNKLYGSRVIEIQFSLHQSRAINNDELNLILYASYVYMYIRTLCMYSPPAWQWKIITNKMGRKGKARQGINVTSFRLLPFNFFLYHFFFFKNNSNSWHLYVTDIYMAWQEIYF